MKPRTLKWLLLSTLVAGACHPALGCAESDFDLAESSRLPTALARPPNLNRREVSARLSYHLGLAAGEGRGIARLWLVNRSGLATREALCENWNWTYPPASSGTDEKGYPHYSIINCYGTLDVIEHRKMEPIFYMVDDPAILAAAHEWARHAESNFK
ncbi:MAG TPA: hypothetical protein VKI43_14510 [Vicinamibacterales bacterium]|nr:hypothetical protein [Vicinamibacterales bacterium]